MAQSPWLEDMRQSLRDTSVIGEVEVDNMSADMVFDLFTSRGLELPLALDRIKFKV